MVSIICNKVIVKIIRCGEVSNANCLWQCQCGCGGMLAATTPQCITCFHHTRCETCQVYTATVTGESRPAHRSARRYPSTVPRSEDRGQGNKFSLTSPIAQSMDALKPLPGNKSSVVDKIEYSQFSGTGERIQQALLLQGLALKPLGVIPKSEVGNRDWELENRVIKPAELHYNAEVYYDEGDEQSSPGESTPGSDPTESWQESEDERNFSIDCDTILQLIRTPLDELFEMWLEESRERNGGQRASSSSKSAPKATDDSTRQHPESKRKRANNSDEQDTDLKSNRPGSAEKKRRKTTPLDTKLACPYFKKDPQRHRGCCAYGGKKLSYVKQHIGRSHNLSLYCPVCMVYFTDDRLRDEHIIARSCEPGEDQQAPEGITLDQRLWLGRRGPSNLSEEQHWYRIFEYLFPGHPLPRSPYNDTPFSEEFFEFREHLGQAAGLDMLLSRVRQNPSWTADHEALFVPDIQQELGQLYWTWAAERQGQSDQAIAVGNHVQESQATVFPVMGEEVHQSDPQIEGGPVTFEDNSNMFVSMPGEEEPSGIRNLRTSNFPERDQTAHNETEPVSAAIKPNSGREQQKLDDDEELDDGEDPVQGGEPSSIALTRIRHDQPRARLMGLDYADNELFDLLGDDTQAALAQADFEFMHPAAGFEDSGLWSMPSMFAMDDAPYLLEDFEAPPEVESPDGVGGPSTDIKVIGDEEETAITTEFEEFAAVEQPSK